MDGVLGIVETKPAVTAAVTARGGQQKHVGAFGCVFRERASHAQ
jgi:hypothetical protein